MWEALKGWGSLRYDREEACGAGALEPKEERWGGGRRGLGQCPREIDFTRPDSLFTKIAQATVRRDWRGRE